MKIVGVKLEINWILFIKIYILSRLHNRKYNIHLELFVTAVSSSIILKNLSVDNKKLFNLILSEIYCQ